MNRRILHIDMDAFYASVEQRDNPAYRGRPVVVGGPSNRGVVAAASYEARDYGIHSAMPSAVARRLCRDLIFVHPRFDVYREISQQIRAVFLRYTELVEPLSLDEAYLDVTHPIQGPPSGTILARTIKEDIVRETGLTASAGVSFNKFLAKVASGYNKPDGLTVIRPEDAEAFIDRLPVERFFGVGRVTAERMHDLGIYRGADLRAWTEEALARHFGKHGRHFFSIVRARDDRAVRPDRRRKSVGAERTFRHDLSRVHDMQDRLDELADRVSQRMDRAGVSARTVTLKIKYHDFELTTRSTTLTHPVSSKDALLDVGTRLLCSPPPPRAVRLLGLSASNLLSGAADRYPVQLSFPF